VVTSGLQDSVFPPDIPVGRVRASKVQAGALSQDVTIDPVVDFTRIEFVKVLLWKGQQ
jgi:cell shape-determining protein MreC